MLSRKERTIWLFLILIAITTTFFVTAKLHISSQGLDNDSTFTPGAPTDIEQKAEEWFTAGPSWPITNYPPFPARYQYTEWKDTATPLVIYQGYIKQGAPWINYPEQIALRVFYPPPEVEGFVPDKVNIYYYNADIATITIVILSPYHVNERRFDFVRVDNVWKFIWVGERSISVQ